MSNSTERQFREADAAVKRAVTVFVREIKPMLGKWEAVAPAYVIERLLLALCTEMSKLTDDHVVRDFAQPALTKLSNALADYRDTRAEHR